MTKTFFWRLAAVLLAGILTCARTLASDTAVARGDYLARIANCGSCHTRAGGDAFSGGVAFDTPFGKLYSSNITSDPKAGIGDWTLEQFARAMREGVRPDGAHLYPAFPYVEFTKVSDADIAALYAWVKTLPRSAYVPPANEMPFPFNQRWMLAAWNLLYLKTGRFTPDTARSTEWNRGAYLIEGLGHCGECHTARSVLGGQDSGKAFQGAVYKDNLFDRAVDWSSVNLTGDANGLSAWSLQDLVQYLKWGVSPRASVVGPMNEVVVNSTRLLSDTDLRAMAVFLKSLPARSHLDGSYMPKDGKILYAVNCGTCHLPNGAGSESTAPPLAKSAIVQSKDPSSLVNIILNGDMSPSTPPSKQWQTRVWKNMPAFGDTLGDDEVATLSTYIRNAFGNQAPEVAESQVAKQR